MSSDLHVLGVGELSRGAVEGLSRTHPEVRATLFSRDPAQRAAPMGGQVELLPTSALSPSRVPLVVCLAEDEAALLRSQGSARDRLAVFRANWALLRRVLRREVLADRLILIVTNPVELVCEALRATFDAQRVYGVGMDADAARVQEALTLLDVPPALARTVDVTGLHFLSPLPCVDALPPEVRAAVERLTDVELAQRLDGHRSPWLRETGTVGRHYLAQRERQGALERAVAHHRVRAVVSALTLAEFAGDRPPRARGVAALTACLEAILDGRPVRLSGPSPQHEGTFLGGTLDPVRKRFSLPALSALERGLLAEDVRGFTSLKKELLT